MSRANGPREGSHAYLIPGQRERVETWRIPRNRGYQETGHSRKKVSGTFFVRPRSPARPDCCFQAQPFDDPRSPPFVAIRSSTRDRMPDGRQFGLGLRDVHVVQPAGVSSDGPRCQD